MIVEGGNLNQKYLNNKANVRVGDRITVTAAIAPAVRGATVVEISHAQGGVLAHHDDWPEGSRLGWSFGEFVILGATTRREDWKVGVDEPVGEIIKGGK